MVVEKAVGDGQQRRSDWRRNVEIGQRSGTALGSATQAWPVAGGLRRHRAGIPRHVARMRLGRAFGPAIDARGGNCLNPQPDSHEQSLPHRTGHKRTSALRLRGCLNLSDPACGRRVIPDRAICRRLQPEFGDVTTVRKVALQHFDEPARQILIEEQLHAGVTSRRSRIAANSSAAATCRSASSGKSSTMSWADMPEAK